MTQNRQIATGRRVLRQVACPLFATALSVIVACSDTTTQQTTDAGVGGDATEKLPDSAVPIDTSTEQTDASTGEDAMIRDGEIDEQPTADGATASDGNTSVANCANVGCGAPPLCSLGCKERCGCCPCGSGSTMGNDLVCVGGCFVTKCTPSADQTCNDRLEMSSLAGKCLADGTCECHQGFALTPATGRCR